MPCFTAICGKFDAKASFFGRSLCCGSAQRGENVSGRSKPLTASKPLHFVERLGPEASAMQPLLGWRWNEVLFKKGEKSAAPLAARCARGGLRNAPREAGTDTLGAATDSGLSESDASIHAQTFSAWVIPARKERAKEVRPPHLAPTTSVIAPPNGNLPCSTSSTAGIPVAAIGRTVRGCGVSTEGIRLERAAPIWARRASGRYDVFGPFSPYPYKLSNDTARYRMRHFR